MLFNSRFMHIIYGKWILNLFFRSVISKIAYK